MKSCCKDLRWRGEVACTCLEDGRTSGCLVNYYHPGDNIVPTVMTKKERREYHSTVPEDYFSFGI